ncbi:MAG TPA: glycosyltransferase family 39 protein [Vicinamibacterales bacterium]|nr:glycosyltransferase family 39 protein [Vicinamibacterales bacterium]
MALLGWPQTKIRNYPTVSSAPTFFERHFAKAAVGVLALAAFNLMWRLNNELVSEWDESLYAISAWEMIRSGRWIGTTFLGNLDYYNVKPPLNVWLVALSFKAFGASLVSMRLVSTLSACCTVAVLQVWVRRLTQPAVGLLAGVVLASSFAFVYVHAGRSGNADSLFTLLILLTVVALWAAQDRPWRIVWVGPLAAAVFLLKGMAVLMPLSIVLAVEVWRRANRRRREWIPVTCALLLFVVPVGVWIWSRWNVDQSRFLARLFLYDFIGGSFTVLEGHEGGPLYYANVLQKYHYDWLLAGAAAWLLFPISRSELRNGLRSWWSASETSILLCSWATITVLIPTLMRTKNSWYLQPFYPVFAFGIAWLVVRGLTRPGNVRGSRRRQVVLASLVVMVFAVAEGRLVSYSYHYRDLEQSPQGLLLAETAQLAGQQVFRDRWNYAEIFVVRALIGAEHRTAEDLDAFLRASRPGNYLLSTEPMDRSDLFMVRSNGRQWLYRRTASTDQTSSPCDPAKSTCGNFPARMAIPARE